MKMAVPIVFLDHLTLNWYIQKQILKLAIQQGVLLLQYYLAIAQPMQLAGSGTLAMVELVVPIKIHPLKFTIYLAFIK